MPWHCVSTSPSKYLRFIVPLSSEAQDLLGRILGRLGELFSKINCCFVPCSRWVTASHWRFWLCTLQWNSMIVRFSRGTRLSQHTALVYATRETTLIELIRIKRHQKL